MTKPNFERLRDAFAIIDGIPTEQMDLETWLDKKDDCGTIACAAGWLAMHPMFNMLGLQSSANGAPEFRGHYGHGAIATLFGVDFNVRLFELRGHGFKDNEVKHISKVRLSDKQLWKRRLLRLFQEHNEPFDPKVAEGLHLDARGEGA